VKAMIRAGDHGWIRRFAWKPSDRVTPSAAPRHRARPVRAPPRVLSVTEIKRLIREPFSDLRKHSLKLRALNPLVQSPTPLSVQSVCTNSWNVSSIGEQQDRRFDEIALARDGKTVLETEAPGCRPCHVLTKIERIADWFIETRRSGQVFHPCPLEKAAKGSHSFADSGLTLTGLC